MIIDERPDNPSRLDGIRVLFVDDAPLIRELLSVILAPSPRSPGV
jgi:hypothetical protein